MLVRAGMKYYLRPVFFQNCVQPALVRRSADDLGKLSFAFYRRQLVIYLVYAEFPPAEKHKRFGRELHHLAADRASYRTAGAGYHHPFTGDVFADYVLVNAHHFASQEILNLDLAHLAEGNFPVNKIADGRRSLYSYARLFAF